MGATRTVGDSAKTYTAAVKTDNTVAGTRTEVEAAVEVHNVDTQLLSAPTHHMQSRLL